LRKDIYKLSIPPKIDKHLKKLSKKDKKTTAILIEGIKEIRDNPYQLKILKSKFLGYRRIRKEIIESFSRYTMIKILLKLK
jgi:mRNA-degrading endonuclease RelE of RelBE toxin-antitoxin system